MTEKHHPDTPVESIRLRKMMGTSLITDSFGESRYVEKPWDYCLSPD
jgi:protein phosphatase PTC6